MTLTTVSLESVAAAFEKWRQERSSPRQGTPDTLQQQAVALLDQHTTTQVINAIGSNHTALKRWRQRFKASPQASQTPQAQGFVPVRGLSVPASEAALQVTLQWGNDKQLSIHGDLSPQHLAALASLLRAEVSP